MQLGNGRFTIGLIERLQHLGPKITLVLVAHGVVKAVVNAVVLARVLVAVVRAFSTPLASSLRLFAIPNRTAAYLFVWGRRLVNISVYGYLAAQVALLLGLPEVGFALLTKRVGLVVTALLEVARRMLVVEAVAVPLP